jgi:hypothetical protein
MEQCEGEGMTRFDKVRQRVPGMHQMHQTSAKNPELQVTPLTASISSEWRQEL